MAEEAIDHDPILELLHERDFSAQLHTMGHSVASHTKGVITTAMGMIGVPYRRGGSTAETGFDCSGFVWAIYKDTLGHMLPRKASEQAQVTKKIDKKELQPGDLVFFNTMRRAFSHVGIYVGDGKFIHSPSKGKRVRVESMESSYWVKRFNGARRVPVSAVASAAAVSNASELVSDVTSELLDASVSTAP